MLVFPFPLNNPAKPPPPALAPLNIFNAPVPSCPAPLNKLPQNPPPPVEVPVLAVAPAPAPAFKPVGIFPDAS